MSCYKIAYVTPITKTSSGTDYLYFQAGSKSMYITPKNDPSKTWAENIVKALKYTHERIAHYDKAYDELFQFPPRKEHKQYARK